MRLYQQILTRNACYTAGKKIKVRGIMVHSTGANNPRISRYVAPDDGRLGKNQYNNDWNRPHPDGRSVCVHGFIGLLADGTVATYQTLPWDHRGWHAGGAANDTHIGFEICEASLDDKEYFKKVYLEAVELCVYLCQEFDLTEKNIICHSEGHAQGVASNHADVMHWFPRHGKSMDSFRADVAKAMQTGKSTKPDPGSKTSILGDAIATADQMKEFLKAGNPAATEFMDLPELFLEEGQKEGVRGDIAFAQSILETGYFKFSGDVKADQNNFSGIGAIGGGNPGHTFSSKREGVRAQIQHLLAYASDKTPKQTIVDPRFKLVKRGSAPFVEWLGIQENPQGAGWASGKDYGAKILRILNEILNIKSDVKKPSETIDAPMPTYKTHTVKKGDTLWEIAKQYLGDGRRFPEIKELNKLTSDVIYVGQKLVVDSAQQAEKPVQVGDKVFVTAERYSTGEEIPNWVKQKTHVVSQIGKGKVLLGHPNGINSWVPESGIKKA